MSGQTGSRAREQELARAAAILRDGGVVAFPTETYYGLAVDPFNDEALAQLFTVKKRPEVKPILVLIAHQSQLELLVRDIPEPYPALMARFWPGPLTLVFPAKTELPGALTGGSATVGIRLSPHPLATGLVTAFGGPLTATSANISGSAAAISAPEVISAFGPKVALVLGGGTTTGGLGSTVIGTRQGTVYCIREGRVPFAEIAGFLRTHR